MSSILKLVKYLSLKYINKNSICLDATCGNGFDTLFLAKKTKKVYSFDIQELAINRTKEKASSYNNINFIKDNHENIDKYIDENLDFAIYNLGYLPNSDKKIVTKYQSTIKSIQKTINLLNRNSGIIITAYPGTEEGREEADALVNFFSEYSKSYDVFTHKLINKINNPPFIIEIIKK